MTWLNLVRRKLSSGMECSGAWTKLFTWLKLHAQENKKKLYRRLGNANKNSSIMHNISSEMD